MPELPPWLTQPADPGRAFLQGAQTGNVIAQSWNQNAITRSRLRLGEQEEQLNALKLRQAIKVRDQQIEAEFIMAELGERIAPMLEKGQANEARSVLLATAARKTALLHLPQYPELMKDVEAAVVTETVRLQHQSMEELRKSQIYENKAQAELALAEATDMQLGVGGGRFAPDRISKLITGREQARAEGRSSDVESFDAEIARARTQQTQSDARIGQAAARLGISAAELSLKLREAGVKIEPEPVAAPAAPAANGSTTPAPAVAVPALPVLTPTARPLTTANVTAGQKDLQAADSAISSISKSRQALAKNPDAAGFEGYIKELYEGIGGQLGLKPGTRITGTRTELRDTANQLVTGLRVEVGQMSDWERKLIDSITDPLDKLANADVIDERLAIVERLIAGRTLRRSRDLHVEPSSAVLSALTDEDLADAGKAGHITPAQARSEYQRRGRRAP